MDVARTINKRNAKKVMVIYRRAKEQMPAEKEEVEAAMEEGIEFLFQNNIVKVIGKNKVEAVECIRTELVKVEGDRERPVNIEGSNYLMDVDFVIMALGSKPDTKILYILGLKLNKWGYIDINENYETSDNKVFAAGDISGAKSTVAWAARSGLEAAKKVYERVK